MALSLKLKMLLAGSLLLVVSSGFAAPAEDHWSLDSESDVAIKQNRALDMINEKDYRAAVDLLVQLTKEAPADADAFNLLGYAYRHLGDLEKSMAAYDRSLYLKPDHVGALEYQGELFLSLGDIDRAEANLQKLKSVCPDNCDEINELSAAIEHWRKSR